jgi:hypothetical protein
MPLSIVGATQAARSGSTITLPVPTGVQNGDLLLVGVHQDSGTETTLTPPQPGRYKLRLYSHDPSTPAPLMWSDGDWTLEVRS